MTAATTRLPHAGIMTTSRTETHRSRWNQRVFLDFDTVYLAAYPGCAARATVVLGDFAFYAVARIPEPDRGFPVLDRIPKEILSNFLQLKCVRAIAEEIMAFPKTSKEMDEQGYEFTGSGKCRDCGAELDWYRTPAGKSIPMNAGLLEPHWATCPHADRFRKKPVKA